MDGAKKKGQIMCMLHRFSVCATSTTLRLSYSLRMLDTERQYQVPGNSKQLSFLVVHDVSLHTS